MKVCEMASVREWSEGYPVELWRDEDSGRLVIRAKSECGNSIVHVDLWDVVAWCLGPSAAAVQKGNCNDANDDNELPRNVTA